MTALVFDRLSPDARRLAVQASQKYLGNKDEAPGYVGIFGIDLALTPYAPFTRNARVLRQALNKMDSRASSTFNNAGQNERRSSLDAQAAAAGQAAAAAESAGGAGAGAAVGGAPGDAMLAQMAVGNDQGLRGHGARSAGILHDQRSVHDHQARCDRCQGAKA